MRLSLIVHFIVDITFNIPKHSIEVPNIDSPERSLVQELGNTKDTPPVEGIGLDGIKLILSFPRFDVVPEVLI